MSESWYYVNRYGTPGFIEKVVDRSTAKYLFFTTTSGCKRKEAISSNYNTYRKTRTEALHDYISRVERRIDNAKTSLASNKILLEAAKKMIP